MSLFEGIDVTPQSTLSTIQFSNEAINTVITSLLTTLVIANLGSLINRLVFLSNRDSFSYTSFCRSFIFINSDDPLRLLSWFRGRYEYKHSQQQSSTQQKIQGRRLITPLLARIALLIVGIGSIALALPSEKRLDACSRRDQALIQIPLPSDEQLVVDPQQLLKVCSQIPLRTQLGTVRSSASYCSVTGLPVSLSFINNFEQVATQVQTPGFIGTAYSNDTGALVSLIFSGDSVQALNSFVEWKTEDDKLFRSIMPIYNGERHLDVLAQSLSQATGQQCRRDFTITNNTDAGVFFVSTLDCQFEANDAITYVAAGVRESLRFQEQSNVALRIPVDGVVKQIDRICAIDVSVTRPLINIVPLAVGLLFAFCLNMAVAITVSHRGNAMDAAFHIVREILGHDTSANPLQTNRELDDVQMVALQKFLCADGISAHVGFVQGVGDIAVREIGAERVVGRCMQVACRGLRFVKEGTDKGVGSSV
ncbi:unnamed protein product [Agarophyton chilense]|eukprot:gb/GEZJ01002766.1/.p1 GENE.gb/GEZJ01002766.1/~~gb/GEZJ01002766.1/.p1  ORF type:complete len:479 (-),score=62.54 gb/GEZJ01002766.1/:797-2233(-)